MNKTTKAPANVQEEPQFEKQSELMTFYLCGPKGIAWTEAVAKATTHNERCQRKSFTDREWQRKWRGHAKWLVDTPRRRHNFDLDVRKDGERIWVVHKSGRSLVEEERQKLIEEQYGNSGRNRRKRPGTASVEYEAEDYDIGEDGSGYVYAYYLPEYRKNKGGEDFRIKIGRSINYSDRINAQATGQPEKLKLSVLWRTDEPETGEKLLHGLLKFRGKHLSDAPGTEWFLTSPDEIIQIIECIQPGVRIRKIPTAKET